jgi:large subunit ribosomal protein L18Ae
LVIKEVEEGVFGGMALENFVVICSVGCELLFILSKMVKGVGIASSQKKVRQFYIVGRALPSEETPQPELYRMRVFARDAVLARSKFWYHMKRQHKVRKV